MRNFISDARSKLLVGAITTIVGFGCTPGQSTEALEEELVGEQGQAIQGENLAGSNLAGSNLAGSNLAGVNLAGSNMGGTNLAGNNLAGSNLAGSNLAGNNLAGNNLAGSNLAGSNLAGNNLAGSNLAGSNLAGSNLAGSNLAGSNLAGNNLAGSNLAGSNLAGSNSGANIHQLGSTINGMLYSGEDLWFPPAAGGTNSSQRVVLGIGSTVFPKLLGEQSANATIYVALGKLPWGFADTLGGPKKLEAWEAIVWGDLSYNVFVLTAPVGSNWKGVAGFIKAIFRWNAPPTQSMQISGIEASAAVDPTVQTTIDTYTGMMNAAAKYNAGALTAEEFVVGELVLITATTNTTRSMIDYASWVMDSGATGTRTGAVLGNVTSGAGAPTKYEYSYYALKNPDGSYTVDVFRPDMNVIQPGMDGIKAFRDAFGAYAGGAGYTQQPSKYRPVPVRCAGYIDMKGNWAMDVPPNKCDPGLTNFTNGYDPTSSRTWSSVAGTTAPMNSYMVLPLNSTTKLRRLHATHGWMPVISETYIHFWGVNYVLNRAAGTNTTAATRSGYGTLCTGSSHNYAFDNQAFQVSPPSSEWCTTGSPTTSAYKAAMTVALTSFVPKQYMIITNGSDATRDPKDWVFQGCSTTSCTAGSDTGWVTLDTQVGQTFQGRINLMEYPLVTSTAYQRYRIKITKNNGSTAGTSFRDVFISDT